MKDTFPEIKEQKGSDKSGFKVPLKVMVLMHTYSLSNIWRQIGLSHVSNMLAWQKDRIVDLKTKDTYT